MSIQKVEQMLQDIHARNQRVEADKAWETSDFRKASIVLITYIFAAALMWVIGVEKPFVSALIPVLGFLLSTLSLSALKTFWLKKFYKPEDK